MQLWWHVVTLYRNETITSTGYSTKFTRNFKPEIFHILTGKPISCEHRVYRPINCQYGVKLTNKRQRAQNLVSHRRCRDAASVQWVTERTSENQLRLSHQLVHRHPPTRTTYLAPIHTITCLYNTITCQSSQVHRITMQIFRIARLWFDISSPIWQILGHSK